MRHARRIVFQLAQVTAHGELFAAILERVTWLLWLLAKLHTCTLGGSGEQGRVLPPFRWKAHFGLAKRVFWGAEAHSRDAASCLGGSEHA